METRSSSSSSYQFALLIMVILLALPNCYASKGTEKDGVRVPAGREHMSKAKDMFTIPVSIKITRINLGGRKMMSEGNVGMEMQESKKNGAATEAATSKNISGASCVKKRKLSMQGKMSTKLQGGKVNKGGFMALNADYHDPRAHPPRNN